MSDIRRNAASYRDPSGHVYHEGDRIVRTVSPSFAEQYDLMMSSGLYETLTSKGYMVPHEELDGAGGPAGTWHKVLAPEVIPYVSYPYEWCFSQLKDAALLTLRVMDTALDHGMVLKDATAYNVQFTGAKPVFIDTLSFERYDPGEPWIAYRQFCRHFLAPLALMALTDVRAAWLLRDDIDGVPLDLASAMLPSRSRMRPAVMMHVHAHAKAEARYGDSGGKGKTVRMSETALRGLVDSLRRGVKSLEWEPSGTEWGDYYEDTNYSDSAMSAKEELVGSFIDKVGPALAWDLGANTARFSRLASERGAYTVAFDIDPAAIEKAYRDAKGRKDRTLLPLRMDLMNPSPSVGWRLAERSSFAERGRPDLVLALALVHHLAIGRNVPLDDLADFFASVAPSLVIEFVPKSDSQVERLLASREDIFPDYTREGFEAAFGRRFETLASEPVAGSERQLYLLRRREAG